MKFKILVLNFLLVYILIPEIAGEGNCSDYTDPCLCNDEDDCFWDEYQLYCVPSAPKFSKFIKCKRPDVYYMYGMHGNHSCKSVEGSGDCAKSSRQVAINMAGEIVQGSILYGKDYVNKKSATNECTQSFAFWEEIYKTVVEGPLKDRVVGKCTAYDIPKMHDGLYEIMINALPLEDRCMDIKLGGEILLSSLDYWKISARMKCFPPVVAVVKFLFDKKNNVIYVKGRQNPVEIDKQPVKLEFCYGNCDGNKKSVYSASAFSVFKFSCVDCANPFPPFTPTRKPPPPPPPPKQAPAKSSRRGSAKAPAKKAPPPPAKAPAKQAPAKKPVPPPAKKPPPPPPPKPVAPAKVPAKPPPKAAPPVVKPPTTIANPPTQATANSTSGQNATENTTEENVTVTATEATPTPDPTGSTPTPDTTNSTATPEPTDSASTPAPEPSEPTPPPAPEPDPMEALKALSWPT